MASPSLTVTSIAFDVAFSSEFKGIENPRHFELLEFVTIEYYQPFDVRIAEENGLDERLTERSRATGDEGGSVAKYVYYSV